MKTLSTALESHLPKLKISDNLSLSWERFGNPEDPPIILIMGATASMLWWPQSLCEGLAARSYQVVRYDHRDTGQSTSVAFGEADYSAEDMVTDLIGLLDGLQIDSAHIVGMSLGGLIGQMVAISNPDRVRSLTLIGAEPLGWTGDELPGLDPSFLKHFEGLAELEWSDRPAVTAFLLESARLSAGRGTGFDPERERQRIEAEIERAGGDISSAFNHGSVQLREDWTGRLSEISQPVLVLHGAEDPIAPVENGKALATVIQGAQLVVVDDVGHELPETVVPWMVDAIGSFVLEVDGSTAR